MRQKRPARPDAESRPFAQSSVSAGAAEPTPQRPAPAAPAEPSERDARGRFTVGHPKRGGRRRGSRNKATSRSPAPPRAPVPEPGQRDPRGRFLAGHAKRGGRCVGSFNKGTASQRGATRMLLEAISRAEAEGRDPIRAVRKIIFEGLDCRYGSPLGLIKLLIRTDRDPPKRRRALSKSTRRPNPAPSGTAGPVIRHEPAAPTPTPGAAPTAAAVPVDPETGEPIEDQIICDKPTRCGHCRGRGWQIWGGLKEKCWSCRGEGFVLRSYGQNDEPRDYAW
jgi:hypothetical protein